MKKSYAYGLIALVVFALVVIPLIVFQNAEFVGTDDQAVAAIQHIDVHYQPWFEGLQWVQSSEIISTLFALQAAIGAGVLGYYIGYSRGKQKTK